MTRATKRVELSSNMSEKAPGGGKKSLEEEINSLLLVLYMLFETVGFPTFPVVNRVKLMK